MKEWNSEIEPEQDAEPKPRVLFLLNALVVGGSECKIVKIANALVASGWSVHMAYLNAPDLSNRPLLPMINKGVHLVCLGRRHRYSVAAALRLRFYMRHHRIQRLVCVNHHPLLYAVPALKTMGRGSPRLISLINKTVFASARETRFMHIYKRLMNKADCIVFGCKYQMSIWVDQYSLDPGKCEFVYNGIDVAEFSPVEASRHDKARQALNPPRQIPIIIGCVGQLRPGKNQRELILAASQLLQAGHCFRVMLVGDGSERAALESQVASLGLQDVVEFQGQVSDIRSKLGLMDVFVLTSRTETFSNAALEAMAMECPVVMSRVSGAEEMVVNGINGYLYELGHPEQLASILAGLLMNASEVRRLGSNARKMVEQRFHLGRMIQDYERILVASQIVVG